MIICTHSYSQDPMLAFASPGSEVRIRIPRVRWALSHSQGPMWRWPPACPVPVTARQPMAAAPGRGFTGWAWRFRLASNEIVETSLGKPAVCKYARRPLAGTWTSHLEASLGPGQYKPCIFCINLFNQPTNHRLATSRPIGPRPVRGGTMARIAKNQTATNDIWANIQPHFPLQTRAPMIVSWWYNCLKTPKLCNVYTLGHMGICLGTRMPVSRKFNSLMPTHNDNKKLCGRV